MRLTKFVLLFIAVLSLNASAQAQRRPNPNAAQAEILITEFRPSGPNGAKDEYVELYNNTNEPLDITNYAIYYFDGEPRTLFIAPVGVTSGFAIIQPRGFYLIANTNPNNANAADRYSLSSYATPDFSTQEPSRGSVDADIFQNSSGTPDPDGGGAARITGLGFAVPDVETNAVFFDSIGFQGRTQFDPPYNLGEGDLINLPSTLPSPAPQYAVVRRFVNGRPVDTNNNANDFVIVSTVVNGFSRTESNGTFPVTPILGAPGPQGRTSPYRGTSNPILPSLLDPTRAANASPNLDRYVDETGVNASVGTLAFRRRITNTGNNTVTNLRFRFVNLTTLNSPNQVGGDPQADGRVLSSGGRTGITRTDSNGMQSPVTFTPMILDAPPSSTADGSGGGLNSTLRVVPQDGITSLAPGGSFDIEYLFGINSPRGTRFRFAVIVETLPGVGATPPPALVDSSIKPEAKGRNSSRRKK